MCGLSFSRKMMPKNCPTSNGFLDGSNRSHGVRMKGSRCIKWPPLRRYVYTAVVLDLIDYLALETRFAMISSCLSALHSVPVEVIQGPVVCYRCLATVLLDIIESHTHIHTGTGTVPVRYIPVHIIRYSLQGYGGIIRVRKSCCINKNESSSKYEWRNARRL
jgi:hypothetical protein